RADQCVRQGDAEAARRIRSEQEERAETECRALNDPRPANQTIAASRSVAPTWRGLSANSYNAAMDLTRRAAIASLTLFAKLLASHPADAQPQPAAGPQPVFKHDLPDLAMD